MNTDDDTNIRTIYKCFKLHARCKHNMHAFRFYLCNWISGNIRIKHLYTTHAVYQKVRTCWHCTRSVEWLSKLVLRMKLDFGQSLPLCLCKLLSADQTVASAIPPSISAMVTFDKSSWAALEPAFDEHIKSNQTAIICQRSQIESMFLWCFLLWLVWSSNDASDENITQTHEKTNLFAKNHSFRRTNRFANDIVNDAKSKNGSKKMLS